MKKTSKIIMIYTSYPPHLQFYFQQIRDQIDCVDFFGIFI